MQHFFAPSENAESGRITITGPASLIGIIDRVMASVDVSTLVSDTSVETNLEIYDKNGELFRFYVDGQKVFKVHEIVTLLGKKN